MIIPFEQKNLDDILREAAVDAVLATTRHNVQYFLGGYRYFFFANMDAIGISRYLPILGYVAEKPDDAFYVGCGNEAWGTDVFDFWIKDVQHVSWSSEDSGRAAADALKKRGLAAATIAVESAFIPADAMDVLRSELPDAQFVDAQLLLEKLRAVKSEAELELVRLASDGIIDSMIATFGSVRPGMTKHEIVERFRQEQTNRGLVFDYCLIAAGPSLNRAPSAERWQPGSVLSLDSGGMYQGYIGDLARMAVHGEPTDRMTDLMDQIESLQQLARTVVKAGTRGADIYDVVVPALRDLPDRENMRFLAHGMGLITHEVPRLTATGPVPYPADHAEAPLQAGNVLSIESWVEDPVVGFIKLEDTLIVTDEGYEAPGDMGRGYNRVTG